MRFTDTHKSQGTYRQRHPLMAVRPDGSRDLTFEQQVGDNGDLLTILDKDPVVRLELDAEGLEFLIASLPDEDGYTELLRFVRELARFKLWDRAVR